MNLYLLRDYKHSEATLGRLFYPYTNLHFHTLELPWRENEPRVSCIPEGIYICEMGRYNKGGYDAYELKNVPDRTHIKIHKGNYPQDVLGCILLGMSRDIERPAVWSSGHAYTSFMEQMKGITRFKLHIIDMCSEEM